MLKQNRLNLIVAVIVIVIVLAMLPVNAQAIGITPGRATMDFEPNKEGQVTFTILNNERKEFRALVYAEGDLMDYITSDKNIVDFTESDESKKFTYSYKLPAEIDQPGDHWAKIVVMEMPPEGAQTGQVVMATTAVIHQLRVKVPYPGKYADLDLVIHESGPDEDTTFFVKIYNVGDEDILKASAIVDILGPTNEVIASIESEEISIESKKRGEVIVPWKANVNPGRYHAVVTVNYDEKVGVVEKTFEIGALRVDVLDISVNNFVLGGIAKFEINMENKWNQKIDDIFAEIIITSQDGDNIANFKSASTSLDALRRGILYAYWDTEGVDKGAYEGKIILHYEGRTTEKELKTYITLENIETEIVGVTARAISRREPGSSPGVDLLVPIVFILIFINVGWFFYFKRRKK